MQVLYDDAPVVYLNGTEIYRNNLPTGAISYTTLAISALGGADESAWHGATVSPSLLLAGANTIAVEIHQADVTSSDISFDFQLSATMTQATGLPPAAPTSLIASALSSSLTGLEHLTHHDLLDLLGIHVCALERAGDRLAAQVRRVEARERASELPERRAGGAEDHGLWHVVKPRFGRVESA